MKKENTCSQKAFLKATHYISGGVNSPVRSFRAVGEFPLFIKKGKGSKIMDIDNNRYIDFCLSWGALILGHAHAKVLARVKRVIKKGTSFGAPTELETSLARLIVKAVPSVEQVRFVNSGTEAVMSAIRLARGFTKKDKIIKFQGCYHGHDDYLLVKAGSGVSELSIATSLGVPKDFIKNTISLPYNNLEVLKRSVARNYKNLAAIIVEPVAANMGLVLPEPGFLQGLREITSKYDILLIFDEVITGFRLGLGGAQEFYKIIPDITCLGKIIGGGFPVGAFGGNKEIMQNLAPLGAVYQAGTLSGNPVAMAAGIETIKQLKKNNIYKNLAQKTAFIKKGIGTKLNISTLGSMFCFFFGNKVISNFEDVKKCKLNQFKAFYNKLLVKGIYLSPSQFETNFISAKHSWQDIEKFIKIVKSAL